MVSCLVLYLGTGVLSAVMFEILFKTLTWCLMTVITVELGGLAHYLTESTTAGYGALTGAKLPLEHIYPRL